MAEIDTGLGWAANDAYLLQAGNAEIATISAPPHWTISGYETQSIPVTAATSADVVTGGLLAFEYVGNRADYKWYYGANKPGVLVAYFVTGDPQNFAIVFFAPDDTYEVYFQRLENGVFQGQVQTLTPFTPTQVGTDSVYNFYSTISGLRPDPGYQIHIPTFPYYSTQQACVEAAWPYIAQGDSSSFTKDNAGYAVACIAKWKTQNNVIIKTPVLISSETDFTDMSTTTTGIYLAKLNILDQGMRFYMAFYDYTGTGEITSALPVVDLSEESPKTLETVFAYISDLDHAAILVLDSPDPYEEENGTSGEEGGDGEELEDDPVEEETLPVPSVAGHGFCTIYVPSSQELNQMASYLWGGSFDVSQVIKLFSNPMDSILGLSAVPVDLVGSPEQIYLGGVALTGVTMPKYTGRTSVKVDFGSVTVSGRWGSYLDYAPYTDFSVYLPFIGIKSIKADDIMGKTVNLTYAIDILSGGCVAYLRPAGGSVLYEWSGQCALQIPVTGRSYDNVFQSAMSVATAAFAAFAAPASAPVLSGAVASAAVQAAASKPHIERSGTVNGITGFLGQLRPYLIRTIPEAYIPTDQNKFIGYPAYINVDLATVKGYNEVDSIHLENVTATGAELDEIETILKGGVIF